MTDRVAYRAFIDAACALAGSVEFEDRLAIDPTIHADRSEEAAKMRAENRQKEIIAYRAAKDAFMEAVTAK